MTMKDRLQTDGPGSKKLGMSITALANPSREAQNDANAKRLWDISANLSGVGY